MCEVYFLINKKTDLKSKNLKSKSKDFVEKLQGNSQKILRILVLYYILNNPYKDNENDHNL